MSSANQNVGRDELAAMLGASHASDLVAAATTAAAQSAETGAAAGGRGSVSTKYVKGGDEDLSNMDRAQAAALVAKKFARGTAGGAGGGAGGAGAGAGAAATYRHRATGKRKRLRQYQLLAGDLMERQAAAVNAATTNRGAGAMEEEEEEGKDVADYYLHAEREEEEQEEESFAARADGAARRKKAEAKILVRKAGDERRNGRRGGRSSDDSESSSSSSDDSRRRRGNGNNSRARRSRSNSSSSSEDEADVRRRRAREQRARRDKSEEKGRAASIDRGEINGTKPDEDTDGEAKELLGTTRRIDRAHDDDNDDDAMSVADGNDGKENGKRADEPKAEEKGTPTRQNRQNGRGRRRSGSDDTSSSSSSGSSSSDSSSESDSDSSSDQNAALPQTVAKPLFVPKSKRGTVAQIELQNQKHLEAEGRRAKEAEKRAVRSRALVAETVSASAAGNVGNDDDGDEFDAGEAGGGGEYLRVPDDADPAEGDAPEKAGAERDAWEVRELIRILRDVDAELKQKEERAELERRRGLTDEERLAEDKRSGRYQAPGEARRKRRQEKGDGDNYLQKFHHRGAFYMDEDTLANAGADDVRHRAAEYSRAATGDPVNRSALPEVMQVKNFGLAGYSTKYKGLAKEDTTDRKGMDFLQISQVRGGRRGDGSSGGRG